MPEELELKALLADPAAVRRRLQDAGAHPGFRGLMLDRRYDRDGELAARGEVFRLRTFRPEQGGEPEVRLSWKGPMDRSPDGYKRRTELEYRLLPGPDPERLPEALGFRPVHSLDRRVEYWELDGAEVRLEWYPRMDRLIEVEGEPAAIERAIAATGIPRDEFTAEPLDSFVKRYAAAGGQPALALTQLAGDPPSWDAG